MIIDAHQHPNWLGHNIDKIVENMNRHQIDASWMLTWDGPLQERDLYYFRVGDPRRETIPLEDVLDACQRYPTRFIAGYAPDPRDPKSLPRLEAAVDLFNVKVYGEWKFRLLVDSPECIRTFRFCGKLKLPVIIHLDVPFLPPDNLDKYFEMWYGGTIENFENALKMCPDTIFLGHGPGYWRYLSGDALSRPEIYPEGELVPDGRIASLLRQYPNLYCDLSAGSAKKALSRHSDYAKEFIDEFQDRVLFARDQFDSMMYDFLISLNLPEAIKEKVFWRNAARLVSIE
jgi:predicted TIM-barrel fold metal-dependent hydrolase